MKALLVAVLLLLAVGAAALAASAFRGEYAYTHGKPRGALASGGYWAFGGWDSAAGPGGAGFGMMGYGPYGGYSEISIEASVRLLHEVLPGTRAFSSNDSVVVYSSNADLLVFTMGHERAVNLTGASLPEHATHDVFVIDGLIDPTIVLEGASTINVTTINLDSSMYHNFVVTALPPPYPYNTMPYEMGHGMVPFLPPANYSEGEAYYYSYVTEIGPGTYWYICTYPGHAQMGMYGQLVVR